MAVIVLRIEMNQSLGQLCSTVENGISVAKKKKKGNVLNCSYIYEHCGKPVHILTIWGKVSNQMSELAKRNIKSTAFLNVSTRLEKDSIAFYA